MPARHGYVGNICTLCIRAYAQMLLLYNSPVMVYICGKNAAHIGRHTNGLFYLLQLLCAELLQNRYISHGCFPDDIPAHAPIAMSDQIAHTLYWPPLNSVCSRGSVFRRKLASQFTDLEYAERNRTLIICIFIKYLERIPVTSYCLFNLDAIIPYMLKPLRIRRQHTNSPSRL